jgi:SAUR family protein
MAMCVSRNKQTAKVTTGPAWYVHSDGGDTGKVPKGYIPIVLVGDESEDNQEGQKVLINVKMLREPCMEALLEMAEEQFGHGQRGVLRIPCSVTRFDQMVNAMISKAASR